MIITTMSVCDDVTEFQIQNQDCLLVTRQNDNHSPGPGPGRLTPSSHQRSELSNTILGTFSRGEKSVSKCIPIPNELRGKATLINISIGNGNLIYYRMRIPSAPYQRIRPTVGILAVPFRPLYHNMSLLYLLRFFRDSHFKCPRMPVMLQVSKL